MLLSLGIVALCLAIALFIVAPLFEPLQPADERDSLVAALVLEKDRALHSLVDLDLDLDTGKLSAEDHGALVVKERRHAAEVMLAMDQMAKSDVIPVDARIDAALSRLRAQRRDA